VGLVQVMLVNGRIVTAVATRPHCSRSSAVTSGACTTACGCHTRRRRTTALVVFPASRTVFVVRVFLHVYHSQSFCFFYVWASVLRRQTPPFLTWNIELNDIGECFVKRRKSKRNGIKAKLITGLD
jgi:hypothetical protein